MGKYKKKLRAEKAKVKLKKKKLPKGQNITDTTFKVKKIITIEQLKKVNENEPVSSWNVPLKDLLIHLGHHNKSSRLNGLNGIKEVIINFPNVLKGPSLKSIVMKILDLMNDVETKVRITALNLLDTLFSMLDSVEMLAFHDVLNIHLACAMTHRQIAVQKDSLRLADIIIKHAPEAIKKNFKIIIVNFIRILSGYKYGAHSEVFLTKGSKKDLEENRIAIFQRLNKILNVCYLSEDCGIEKKGLVLSANSPQNFSKRLLTAHHEKAADLSVIFRPKGMLYNEKNFANHEEDFKTLVSHIMPVLFETWSEFNPASDKSNLEECVLKESTAKLLGLILDIILVLYETSFKFDNNDKKSVWTNYGNQFVKSFLSRFPYLPQIFHVESNILDSALKQEESAVSYSRSYQSQNLTICYLSYKMKLKISNERRQILDNYVLSTLTARNPKCDGILSKIVEMMVLVPTRHKRVDMFLETSVKAYKATTNEEFQKKLLRILSKIAADDYRHLRVSPCVREWMAYLARGLCKNKIRYEVLVTLSKLIQRKVDDIALKEVESKFTEILKNLPFVEFEGCDMYLGRKCIINILFWCDKQVVCSGLKSGVLEEDGYPDDIRTYITKIMNFKLKEL